MVVVGWGGGGVGWLRPVLGFSLSQAEQHPVIGLSHKVKTSNPNLYVIYRFLLLPITSSVGDNVQNCGVVEKISQFSFLYNISFFGEAYLSHFFWGVYGSPDSLSKLINFTVKLHAFHILKGRGEQLHDF